MGGIEEKAEAERREMLAKRLWSGEETASGTGAMVNCGMCQSLECFVRNGCDCSLWNVVHKRRVRFPLI